MERGDVSAVLTPARLPDGSSVMPVLLADTGGLEAAEPLTPAFPLNSARLLSRLSRTESGGRVAAVVRPCELRAFTELEKFHQGSRGELLIVGLDCAGAVQNRTFKDASAEDPSGEWSTRFIREAFEGKEDPAGLELAPACRMCGRVSPEGADIVVGLHGLDLDRALWVSPGTEAGSVVLEGLGLAGEEEPEARSGRLEDLAESRTAIRDQVVANTRESTSTLEGLSSYFSLCVNCLNCRVACPVCYCRECVFATDIFDHEPREYLNWVRRKKAVKMPADTLFYHLTRMAHMALSCVGCGQCSNACPSGIPLAELFTAVSLGVQEGFGYEPGRDQGEPPPLAVFQEQELAEVVGL